MTITSFVVINSKYRTPESRSSTDFTYSIGQSLEVKAVAVKSISIPVLQYNITSLNNSLTVSYGAGIVTGIKIPVAQYNMTTFRATLQEILRVTISDDTLTITQDALTKKLTFTADTVPFQFYRDTYSPLSKIIGLPPSDIPVNTLQLVCPQLPNLGGLKNYYLTSRILSQGFNGVFQNGRQIPLVMTIPIAVPWGTVEHYEPDGFQLNIKKYNRPQNIQMIDIQILDEDLSPVDLNGADIEMVIKIYSESSLESEK